MPHHQIAFVCSGMTFSAHKSVAPKHSQVQNHGTPWWCARVSFNWATAKLSQCVFNSACARAIKANFVVEVTPPTACLNKPVSRRCWVDLILARSLSRWWTSQLKPSGQNLHTCVAQILSPLVKKDDWSGPDFFCNLLEIVCFCRKLDYFFLLEKGFQNTWT